MGISTILCILGSEAGPEVDKQILKDGEFGIPRTVWEDSTKPEDRVKLALTLKDKKIKLTGDEKATVETNKGVIVLKLYSDDAPNTVSNFIRLAESGFYDGLIWHRYEEGFVIQGGDPTGTGRGSSGYNIPFEDNTKTHIMGAMGMARGPDKNSASCQFYICIEPAHFLDGNYCVFGETIEGMQAVEQLRAGDTIIKVSITR